jgi:aconitase A
MFEDRYHKDQPAAKAMAQRIAAKAPQVFKTTDSFVATYGKEAADMVSRDGLLAALRDIGIDAVPASFEGEARDQPKGLSIKKVQADT